MVHVALIVTCRVEWHSDILVCHFSPPSEPWGGTEQVQHFPLLASEENWRQCKVQPVSEALLNQCQVTHPISKSVTDSRINTAIMSTYIVQIFSAGLVKVISINLSLHLIKYG